MPILNKMDILLQENVELKQRLARSMAAIQPPTETNTKFSYFLNLLIETATNNANKLPNAWRFGDILKEIGLYMFSIGNLQMYQFLSANLPFPSISTVRLQIYRNDVIVEGKFRIKELKSYLAKRKYPFFVQCSEDATVVVKRIQYHAPSNQIVGCVLPLDQNGLPISESYPASSAKVISDYFKENEMSQQLYCIMAQPIAIKAPPFCVAMFGTNNKFNAAQVHARWMWTVKALKEEGIQLLSFSSDGDGRLLKTMRHNVFLAHPNTKWQWFQASLKPPFMCVQDHLHLGLKFKTKLLKPSVVLPLGPFKTVSRGHLVELITQTQTRDQHLLCLSDINPKDKMNFKAFQRMSDPKVSLLLKSEIPDSEGTATYLEMMSQVVESYTRVDLTPCERIKMIWEWVFFARMWRLWILATDGYTLKNNFITHNSYYCLELNAHALLQCIIWLRDKEEHSSFLPWLLSSQPCEGTFRRLRSAKLTGASGVVCFTILDAKNYFRRMDVFASTQINLEEILKFPRHQKMMKLSQTAAHVPVCLPENFEIDACVKEAFENAVTRAMAFNLIKTRPKHIPPACLQFVSKSDMNLEIADEDEDDDVCDAENVNNEAESDGELEDEDDSEYNDVIEDLYVASSGPLHLKTYQVANLTESSPFVQVADGNGTPCIIKKSSLCWLLRSEDSKISSDRLLRVQQDSPAMPLCNPSNVLVPCREETISIGDWCAFIFEDSSIGVGRILAFSYLTGTSLSNQEYPKLDAPTTPPPRNARGLGCLCTWFSIKKQQLSVTQMDLHGYYDIKNYVCTIPRPKVQGKKMLLNCTMSQIKKCLQ